MPLRPLSLKIGSLKFNTDSLITIAFGLFIGGILTGTLVAIYTDNSAVSPAVAMLLYMAFVIPGIICWKGFRKAEEINQS